MTDAGRYRLLRTLGVGGMAQVVEAVAVGEAGFERRVALKWVRPEMLDDDGMRRMFLDEARIASRLHHANIVQVLDYGLMDGTDFLVSELVDGVDLGRARTLAGGTLPEAVALHVVAEVAHGLDHAHRATDAAGQPLGIVHRDVSPGNVPAVVGAGREARRLRHRLCESAGGANRHRPREGQGALHGTRAGPRRGGDRRRRRIRPRRHAPRGAHRPGAEPLRRPPRRRARSRSPRRPRADRPLPRPRARPATEPRAVAEVAERLRRARSQETGRSQLAATLATLRERVSAPRGVDRMVGFVVTRTGVAAERAFTLVEAPPTDEPRRVPWRLAAMALSFALALGVLAWSFSSGRTPHPQPLAARSVPAVDAGTALSPPDAGPPPEAAATDAPPPRARPRRRATPPVEAPRPTATRSVQVAGAAVFRHRVQIDGRDRGYAPTRALALPVGTHRVVVLDRESGAPVLERVVTLTADSPPVTRVP